MAWIDACCLQLIVRNRSGKEDKFTFQTDSPNTLKDWIIGTELDLFLLFFFQANCLLQPNIFNSLNGQYYTVKRLSMHPRA